MKLLEGWIRKFWDQITTLEKSVIRSNILNLIVKSNLSKLGRSIREKISNILSDIAKFDFPSLWTNFFDNMVELWNVNNLWMSEVNSQLYCFQIPYV